VAPKANSQLMDIKGKAYLKVPGRVEMFREDHPLGVITTELVHLEPRVIVRAVIHGADGTMIASGYGTAPMIGKGESTWRDKEIEKAETAAVGRALGFAGYGTLAAFADDDRDNLADAPIDPPRHITNGKPAGGITVEQATDLEMAAKAANVSRADLLNHVLQVERYGLYTGTIETAEKSLAEYVIATQRVGGAK
jgi:hypothetical protein